MRSADIDLIPVIKLLNWSVILSLALLRLLLLLLADSEIPDSDIPDSDIPHSETLDGARDVAERPKDAEADARFLNLFAESLLFLNLAGLLVSSSNFVSNSVSPAVIPLPLISST